MTKTLLLLIIGCFLIPPVWLQSQNALQVQAYYAKPPNILVLEDEMLGISNLEAKTLSEYIRSEIISTGVATTVNPTEIQNSMIGMNLLETGCISYSCIKEMSSIVDGTHVIIWSLTKTDEKYRLDFRYLDVVEEPTLVKQRKRRYKGDENGLVLAIQRTVWDVMSIPPPGDRFPKGATWIAEIGRIHVIGGVALVLVGVGIAVGLSGEEPEGPSDEVGTPPDWPVP